MSKNPLESLVDVELSGVGFVRDYVELYFDGPVLRLLGKVTLQSPSNPSQQRLETRLIALIGSSVTAVRNVTNALEVEFSGAATIRVQADADLPEYAHLMTFPDNRMVVWQAE